MKRIILFSILCIASLCSCSNGTNATQQSDNENEKYITWKEETDPFKKLLKYIKDEKNNNWVLDETVYTGNRGGVSATRTILYTMYVSGDKICFETTDITDHPEGMCSDPQHDFNLYSTFTFSLGNVISGSWNVMMHSKYVGYKVYVYPEGTTFDSEAGRIGASSYTLKTDNVSYFNTYGTLADSRAQMAIRHIGFAAVDYNKEATKIGLPLLS